MHILYSEGKQHWYGWCHNTVHTSPFTAEKQYMYRILADENIIKLHKNWTLCFELGGGGSKLVHSDNIDNKNPKYLKGRHWKLQLIFRTIDY